MNTNDHISADLVIGKWYVFEESDTASREDTIVAGPFDTLAEAERYPLPNEMLPSQYGVFEHQSTT